MRIHFSISYLRLYNILDDNYEIINNSWYSKYLIIANYLINWT